jgi:hypothetical protein
VEERQLEAVGHASRAPDIVLGEEGVGDGVGRAFEGSFMCHGGEYIGADS